MALFAFDGTWNSEKADDDPQYSNTNVVRFFRAYREHSATDDFYVAGVGTRFDLLGKVMGGAFGMGEEARIDEAYAHLCRTWSSGDRTIDVVGFSRGAATTLDFCEKVQADGIRHPDTGDLLEPNPRLRFVGLWDVVAAFGLANLGNAALNIGHHLALPGDDVEYCFHALALDERRPSFLPTRVHGAREVWFRGVHSDVGGGNGNRGLNDITLRWMFSKAKAAGLPITDAHISALQPDAGASPLFPDPKLPIPVRIVGLVDRRHYSVSPVPECTNPPDTCVVETPEDERHAEAVGAQGLEVLPLETRRKVEILWETADAAARQAGYEVATVKDALINLFQARIPLVTTDDQLRTAQRSVVMLVAAMIRIGQQRSFHVLNEAFLNEALFYNYPLFPFTD